MCEQKPRKDTSSTELAPESETVQMKGKDGPESETAQMKTKSPLRHVRLHSQAERNGFIRISDGVRDGLFEEGEGSEDEAGEDRRRADDIPDFFRDFRFSLHRRGNRIKKDGSRTVAFFRARARAAYGSGTRCAGSGNRPDSQTNQYTISSQGRPYSLSFCMKGAGSNSSMLKTPGPFQVPVASIIAPIMAGTPVV